MPDVITIRNELLQKNDREKNLSSEEKISFEEIKMTEVLIFYDRR